MSVDGLRKSKEFINDYKPIMENIENACKNIWKEQQHAHYTRHDMDHSKKIEEYVNKFLHLHCILLKPIEEFILLAAVYLHDIGMQCNNREFLNNYTNNEIEIKKSDSEGFFFHYTELEIIRKWHNLLSYEMIMNFIQNKFTDLPEFGLIKNEKPIENGIVVAIALTCKSHCDDQYEDYCKEEYNMIIDKPRVNLRLIACLLRLGDSFDATASRCTALNYKKMEFHLDLTKRIHYWKHSLVTNLEISYGVVKIIYNIPSDYKHLIDGIRFVVEKTIRSQLTQLNKLLTNHRTIIIEYNVPEEADLLFTNKNLPKDVHDYFMKVFTLNKVRGYQAVWETYFNKIIERFDKEEHEEAGKCIGDYYVDLDAKNEAIGTIQPVSELVTSWIDQKSDESLILLGDLGAGKTTVSKKIARDNAFKSKKILYDDNISDVFVPFRIEMSCLFQQNIKNISQSSFINYLYDNDEILNRIPHKERLDTNLLLILDGLDELGGNEHIETLNYFNRFNFLNCKVLITSRPQIISSILKHNETGTDDAVLQNINSFISSNKKIVFLQSLCKKKSSTIISFFIKDQKSIDSFNIFLNKHKLNEIKENPLLLILSLQQFYNLKNKKKVSKAIILDSIVEKCFSRSRKELLEKHNLNKNIIIKLLSKLGFLALKQGSRTIMSKDISDVVEEDRTLNNCYESLKKIYDDLKLGFPIITDKEGNYTFSLKIFVEYFASKFLANNYIQGNISVIGEIKLEEVTAEFVIENLLNERNDAIESLNQYIKNNTFLLCDKDNGNESKLKSNSLHNLLMIRNKWMKQNNAVEKYFENEFKTENNNLSGNTIVDKNNMIKIPEGCFIMGSCENVDESPINKINLKAYKICRYAVTVFEFAEYMNSDAFQKEISERGKESLIDFGDNFPIKHSQGKWNVVSGYEKKPITNISWYAANNYAVWKGCRLPSEAEWEKAARGGLGRTFIHGNFDYAKKSNDKHIKASLTNIMKHVKDVDTFSDNNISPYNIVGMSGNIFEWCFDDFNDNPASSSKGTQFIFRGSSIFSSNEDLRCSSRMWNFPYDRNLLVGFRLASSI